MPKLSSGGKHFTPYSLPGYEQDWVFVINDLALYGIRKCPKGHVGTYPTTAQSCHRAGHIFAASCR